jgi:hypothetical protein
MRVKLATLMDVGNTSLEASLPEIQRQFNQLHSEVKSGNQNLSEKVDGLATIFEASMDTRPTRTELAADFAGIAARLAGGGGADTTRTTTTTRTARTTTTTEGGNEMVEEDADFRGACGHLIRIRDIDCVDDIYNEYKGIGGLFQGIPIDGGLEACDVRWKARWRRHFNAADQKRFSRMAMLAKAIDYQVAEEGRLLSEVLGSFDHYFLQKKRSFGGLISLLQAEGLLEKKAPRTKRAVRGESPGEGGGGG